MERQHMRDYLIDIVKHTVPLGAFTTLRIDGSDSETEIAATEQERLMVLRGKLHAPVADFKGLFGIPNLPLLNTVLNIPEYTDAKANYSVTRAARDGEDQATTIHLENASGDFKNDFRLMAGKIIDNMEPKLKFNVNAWPVEFVPTVASQQRLKYQTAAHPEEKAVTFKIEGGNITANLGDASSHSGSFMFHTGVDPAVKKTIAVPVLYVNSVLSLSGDKMIHMGDLGMMISVDSGLANYDYILPMLTK